MAIRPIVPALAVIFVLTSGSSHGAPAPSHEADPPEASRLFEVETLEEFIALAIEGLDAELPLRVGADSTLIAMRADGHSILYVYELDASAPDMTDPVLRREIRARLATIHCRAPWMRRLLDLGGAMRYEYHRGDEPVVRLELDGEACEALDPRRPDLSA